MATDLRKDCENYHWGRYLIQEIPVNFHTNLQVKGIREVGLEMPLIGHIVLSRITSARHSILLMVEIQYTVLQLPSPIPVQYDRSFSSL